MILTNGIKNTIDANEKAVEQILEKTTAEFGNFHGRFRDECLNREHGFKNSVVKTQGGQFNISIDEDDGSVHLTPVNKGFSPNISTGYNSIDDVIEAFPKAE